MLILYSFNVAVTNNLCKNERKSHEKRYSIVEQIVKYVEAFSRSQGTVTQAAVISYTCRVEISADSLMLGCFLSTLHPTTTPHHPGSSPSPHQPTTDPSNVRTPPVHPTPHYSLSHARVPSPRLSPI
ncbi:hypothetical protein E2C01_098521 [Portunus trituberculatus]|uniref:Uncharacterized protein n=1 Tax=Portunus trituberculatus TaxID=210409 RepID=A0A5B7JY13_PORTR|nr:hypothetical protein [Portunus trituberculatus]